MISRTAGTMRRVTVHVGRTASADLVEQEHGLAAADVVLPHPVHGTLGWICVVNPGERTAGTVMRLLRTAHEAAHAQALVNRRRVSGGPQPDKGVLSTRTGAA